MAFEYKTTIHTMEIRVHTPLNHKQFYELYNSRPYLREVKSIGKGTYTMIFNPHKYNDVDADGKYRFKYMTMSEQKQTLEVIKQELQSDKLTVTRLDLCLDPQIDYCYSEKVLRFITLMIANENKADNCYLSIDPLTLETKTIRTEALKGFNGKTYNGGLQVENYNRGLIDQSSFSSVVINRLELRAWGTEAGDNYSPDQIIDRWRTRLQAVSDRLTMSDKMRDVENALNQSLFEKWRRLAIVNGDKLTGKSFNDFVFFNIGSVYTTRQMIELFKLYGDSEQQAHDRNKNIRRLGRKTFKGQLLRDKQIASEVESMISSIDKFSQL